MKTLQQMVSQVESGGNQWALRFEMAHFSRRQDEWSAIHEQIILSNKCSHDTARMIYSTSWGEYQIMGFNLYAQRQGISIGEFLNSAIHQYAAFQTFISKGPAVTDVMDESQLRAFAKFYNGPGNIDEYTRRLIEARDS